MAAPAPDVIARLQSTATPAAAEVAARAQSACESLRAPPPESTLAQLVRYTFVGGLAFACDFALLFALTEWARFHYLLSGAAAFLVGLTVNYALSVRWVFKTRRVADRRMEFLIFGVIGVIGLGLNEALLYLFTDLLGLYYLASKLGATGVGYLWNFFARKYSLFTPKPTA